MVRTLSGKKIRFVQKEDDSSLEDPVEAMIKKAVDEIDSKEARFLPLKKYLRYAIG